MSKMQLHIRSDKGRKDLPTAWVPDVDSAIRGTTGAVPTHVHGNSLVQTLRSGLRRLWTRLVRVPLAAGERTAAFGLSLLSGQKSTEPGDVGGMVKPIRVRFATNNARTMIGAGVIGTDGLYRFDQIMLMIGAWRVLGFGVTIRPPRMIEQIFTDNCGGEYRYVAGRSPGEFFADRIVATQTAWRGIMEANSPTDGGVTFYVIWPIASNNYRTLYTEQFLITSVGFTVHTRENGAILPERTIAHNVSAVFQYPQ